MAQAFEWPREPLGQKHDGYTEFIVRPFRSSHAALGVALLVGSALVATAFIGSAGASGARARYPIGIANSKEPSGFAPPGLRALPGYRRTYVQDFKGAGSLKGWGLFNGVPGGDPTGHFSPGHVQVFQGLLRLKSFRDPLFHDFWVTGGLCQCSRPAAYGAYFVRSRVTAAGTNSVELLWPANNVWPPEVDFNEDLFHVNLTTATVHWSNSTDFHILKINMLRWHTWGIIWTPTYILDVVDGTAWHEVSRRSAVPHVPMVLDLEQRTSCTSLLPCPGQSSSMLIDWVAEYRSKR